MTYEYTSYTILLHHAVCDMHLLHLPLIVLAFVFAVWVEPSLPQQTTGIREAQLFIRMQVLYNTDLLILEWNDDPTSSIISVVTGVVEVEESICRDGDSINNVGMLRLHAWECGCDYYGMKAKVFIDSLVHSCSYSYK